MAPDEPSGPRPAPVVLRIKLRYDDVESMVQRFAPNVGKSGLFLPTKSLQPVGAEVKFELRIADDTPVLVGLGRVKAARPPDPAQPRAAFGMAIELMRVTRESRDVILRMLERRKQLGLPEVGIPMPADIDAARRSEVVDTQVKDTASVAVPAPVANLDSGPSEALLTAPRRQSGPIAIAKLQVIEALAPEAPRKRRPNVHEVIESASGPIVSVVSVPGLDEDVDVGAVLARARVLAGGNLDAELEALREVAAAPLEISIEAASAELARQLGGTAINRKDRSARWEKPPTTISTPAPEVSPPPIEVAVAQAPILEPEPIAAPPPVETIPAAPTFAGMPTFVDEEDSGPLHRSPETPADIITEPSTPAISQQLIDDDADPAAFDGSQEPASEVEPEQIADEIHQLQDDDYEEVEHTQIGAMPEGPSFEQHAFVTEPAVAAELERSLDAHLAEAEAEADADDLGISGAYELPQAEPVEPAEAMTAQPPEEEIAEIDDFEILAEADAEDADLLSSHGEADASGSHGLVTPDREPEPDPDIEPPPRPSAADFVSRLDLSDEFEAAPEPEPEEARPFSGRHASFSELDPALGELDPRALSAGHALAAFDEPEIERSAFDEPASYQDGPTGNPDDVDADSQYTLAGQLPPADSLFDAPHTGFAGDPEDSLPGFAPLRGFDESDVIENRAMPRRHKPPSEPYEVRVAQPAAPKPGDDGYDLETALEALDVDLDDLSVPIELPLSQSRLASQGRAPSQGRASRAPSQSKSQPKRAVTDDGVLIQFDDDED